METSKSGLFLSQCFGEVGGLEEVNDGELILGCSGCISSANFPLAFSGGIN